MSVDPVTKQQTLRHSIEKTMGNVKKLGQSNWTPAKLRSRLANLKESWSRFLENHNLLVSTTSAAARASLEYFVGNHFDAAEEIYEATCDFITECIEQLEPVVSPINKTVSDFNNSRSDAAAIALSHLPPIRLPPFDGNYAEWESFRDRFTSLIMNNPDLSDFARMHYLASALKGVALECIGNVSITADNFKTAWNALTARFENKRRLLNTHLSALLGLSAIAKESAAELQHLCDRVNVALSSLKTLGRTRSDLWNDIVVYLVTQKLDPATRKAWNLKTSDVDSLPTQDELSRFLANRIRALEECTPHPSTKATAKTATSSRVHVATASAKNPAACPLCKARHYLSACPEFVKRSPSQRRDVVTQFKRCFNCLSATHAAKECKSKFVCRHCQQKHHTTLHADSDSAPNSPAASASSPASSTDVTPKGEVTSLLASTNPRARSPILLATAMVNVRVASGRTATVRALLDQGSEATFMSEHLAQVLRVKRISMPLSISAVGGKSIGSVRHAASIIISSRFDANRTFVTTALILGSVTSYAPKRVMDLQELSHLADLDWADDDPSSPDPIHLLIGADLYGDIILQDVRKGECGQPIAQQSELGWVLSGPLVSSNQAAIETTAVETRCANLVVHHCPDSSSLNDAIKRFWEVEELPPTRSLTPLDEKCERHFIDTHSRSQEGRYIVRLPFKNGPPLEIGASRNSAVRLFESVLRRFRVNADIRREYATFMAEYERLGHMQRANDTLPSLNQKFYLPHHAVLRTSSLTTRLRVVFNASMPTSNGTSLNDHLLCGPKLQTDLAMVIAKWRHFRYVYTADIAKMYRQIQIDSRDVDYQRIVWQPPSESTCVNYRLCTVTYGTSCAPYLALRVIQQLIHDDGQRHPLAAPILRDHTYVDDVLFGGDQEHDARQSRDQLMALLRGGGFELRKWASNSAELLQDIDSADHGLACDKVLGEQDQLKILGIAWNPARDHFQFRVSVGDSIPSNKRAILSAIAKLYDPLGWVTPVTVAAKILMQQLWRDKTGWDDALSGAILHRWECIYRKLIALNSLKLERWTGVHAGVSRMELHGFADASTLAYAAVLYLRIVPSDGHPIVRLIAGKSKVAPITPLTVPRLELSAVVLLVRLMAFVRRSMPISPISITCWTDSTVVLCWLNSHPSRWNTFVANRVQAIQAQMPEAEWRHVSTDDNPADCASRGLLGDELVDHDLWWRGPPWLQGSRESWTTAVASQPDVSVLEEKSNALHVAVPTEDWDLASRHSSWPKLLRVTAYLFKFVQACRLKRSRARSSDPYEPIISAEYCRRARIYWIKRIQNAIFSSEIKTLTLGNSLGKRPISALNPFLDTDGILRVGGRLQHAALPYRSKHPALLASHPLVRLIVEQAHIRSLHGGSQLTLSILRRDFWILRARNMTKAVIQSCIVCVRERAAIPTQQMGSLPSMRVENSGRSFTHCGVDYAGPLKVRASAGRGVKTVKAYVALFVCLATRAIHLELVSDCSTPAFVNAFTRFCARRGLATAMYSDNGTTFVGADRELTRAYRAALRDPEFQSRTASDQIVWHFIPPSAPHFGGMWEAGVRSVKHHLRRVLGDKAPTVEEFATLLCHVEACLNSRPLAPLSDDVDTYDCLTPGHFLTGRALTAAPEPSVLQLNENRLSRWQTVRRITERFWKLWTSDYINTLQQRGKWRTVRPSVTIGKMVLLRNAALPPCKWELGRVTAIHPGSDGLTRVVTVKTATSEFRRPIGKMCLLPVGGGPGET